MPIPIRLYIDTKGELKTIECHIKHILPLRPTFSHFTQ